MAFLFNLPVGLQQQTPVCLKPTLILLLSTVLFFLEALQFIQMILKQILVPDPLSSQQIPQNPQSPKIYPLSLRILFNPIKL